jgi:hypothetical protein
VNFSPTASLAKSACFVAAGNEARHIGVFKVRVSGGLKARKNGGEARVSVNGQENWMSAME